MSRNALRALCRASSARAAPLSRDHRALYGGTCCATCRGTPPKNPSGGDKSCRRKVGAELLSAPAPHSPKADAPVGLKILNVW